MLLWKELRALKPGFEVVLEKILNEITCCNIPGNDLFFSFHLCSYRCVIFHLFTSLHSVCKKNPSQGRERPCCCPASHQQNYQQVGMAWGVVTETSERSHQQGQLAQSWNLMIETDQGTKGQTDYKTIKNNSWGTSSLAHLQTISWDGLST